jgi:hypothetical protein
MDEWLTLPVTYQGKDLEFEARVYQYGYIHRFEVIIDGIAVQFEQDDEENYRALVTLEEMSKSKTINVGLLEVMALQLKQLSAK